MTYTIYISKDRTPFLEKESFVKKIEKDVDDATDRITIELENSMDALMLFQSGVLCGLSEAFNK